MVFKNENLKGLGIRKADTRLRAESLALASLPRPPPAGGITPAGLNIFIPYNLTI